MNNIPETLYSHFTKEYKKNGYLDKYGGSVVIAILTLIFFFLVLSYYYIKDKMEPIRQNWAQERCKPGVMPFAGIIKEQDLPKGTILTEEMIDIRRPGTGILPRYYKSVLGKRVKKDVKCEDPLTFELIE